MQPVTVHCVKQEAGTHPRWPFSSPTHQSPGGFWMMMVSPSWKDNSPSV